MGEVYKARGTRLDRTVAIKVLPAHLADKPELRERFEREAKTIASLNHPHICILHDVGHQDGTDFLVMEYLEGETLADRLLKGPLPLDQVLFYAIDIADALDKAHRKSVTHRDIKPGNILLTKNGAKLLDFGLAKLKEAADARYLTTGSLAFLRQGTIFTVPFDTNKLEVRGNAVAVLKDVAQAVASWSSGDLTLAGSGLFRPKGLWPKWLAHRLCFPGPNRSLSIDRVA